MNLTDLDRALGSKLLAGADKLRWATYWLYGKADDLHYFLERWDRTLHTSTGPW